MRLGRRRGRGGGRAERRPARRRLGGAPGRVARHPGRRPLGYSTYCWTTQCADYINPEMRDDLPTIAVRRGQVVRFRLGFIPTSLSLQVGGRSYELKPKQNAAWRVRGKGGVLVLFATAEGGDASYVAKLRVKAAKR
jgi:hypothetical protein